MYLTTFREEMTEGMNRMIWVIEDALNSASLIDRNTCCKCRYYRFVNITGRQV